MEPIYEIKENTLIVSLCGEIDHHVAGKIREDIDGEMKLYKAENLIMNFADVTFMDSSGVGMVLGRHKKIKEMGGKLTICGCDRYVKRILYMSGVFTLIGYAENPEAALKGGILNE